MHSVTVVWEGQLLTVAPGICIALIGAQCQ
jgi:hypothetical protein